MFLTTADDAMNANNEQLLSANNWRMRPLARAVVSFSCTFMLFANTSPLYAAPALNALPQAGANWVQAGSATQNTVGNTMTIEQGSNKAILNWNSFNIGGQAAVQFNQPSSSSIVLNRIGDAAASEILGRLGANGSVYLVNNNGIIFGQGAQVNVHGLVASTLNVDPNQFMNGSIATAITQGNAALEGGTAAEASVVVQAGAKIETDSGGQVLMFAPNVINQGDISTPDGQTLLAASKNKVYLVVSDKSDDLRGLLVEVDSGGNVENVGQIVAERGNVTLLGLAVNQNGRIRATTSVDVNGSVRLIARDNAGIAAVGDENKRSFADAQFFENDMELISDTVKGVGLPIATRSGNVTFGSSSVTEVTADSSGKTASDASPQPQSRIQVMGEKIELKSSAQIINHGGKVDLIATSHPDAQPASTALAASNGHIYLGQNSKIDVSGENVLLPVERRVVEVELRGDELKDSPLQRNGVLRGEKVKVDIDTGSPLIADLTPWLARVQKGVKERLTAGGSINMRSSNDVVMASGANLDISGGSITYASGLVSTTKLLSGGRLFDIGSADPNRIYDGILGEHTATHPKWGKSIYGSNSIFSQGIYREGYTDGKAGGSLAIDTRALYGFDLAELHASTTAGIKQREVAKLPAGSKVNIQTLAQDILIEQAAQSANLTADTLLSPSNGVWPALYLSTDMLNRSGLRELTLTTTNGKLQVGSSANLVLGAGSKFTGNATQLDVNGKLRLPSGEVNLTTLPNNVDGLGNFPIRIGAGADINVGGLWTNDLAALQSGVNIANSPIALNGGSIAINAKGDVDVVAGAKLHADAGAQLNSSGQVTGGNGGSISLLTQAKFQDNRGSIMNLAADTLSAYGFNKGGKLALGANSVLIGGVANDAHTLSLAENFFTHGGFGAYNINANLRGLQVADNAQVALTQQNLLIDDLAAAALLPSGNAITALASITTLRDELRAPVDLTLSSQRSLAVGFTAAPVRLGTGSRITGEPGAKISVAGDDNIYIDGTVSAPGGSIAVNLNSRGADPYRPELAIWFGEHAHLLAPAAQELQQNNRGLLLSTIFDAGKISVTAQRGSIVAQPGATFDVSGAEFAFDRQQMLGGILSANYQRQPVYAAAGSIDFTAAESLLVYGTLSGRSVGDGLGGSLSFRLDGSSRGSSVDNPFPVTAPTIDISAQLPQWDSSLAFGAAIPAALNRHAVVGADSVAAGGFSRLTLGAANVTSNASNTLATNGSVRFVDDVTLNLADRLWIDATSINVNNHHVNITAANVQLGQDNNDLVVAQKAPTPAAGTGLLNIAAKFIELFGNFSIGGADRTVLHSDGDIRLRSLIGVDSTNSFARVLAPGKLTVAGDLDLAAAQIYPSTLSDYTIELTGPNSVFSTSAAGARSPILSAGGKLTILAPFIEHGGVLAAPLGQILLGNANTQRVHLLAGSTLDVSSDHLVPFGSLRGGDLDWIYPIDSTHPLVIDTPPEKRVDIVAANVAMDDGARVNLSGGGDIYAYEFVSGPGGSKDFLKTENANGAFAVVPWLNSQVAPYDTIETTAAGIETGRVVYLDGGVAGLPAGYYAVLPAHYALLPGAYLLTPSKAAWNPGQTAALIDGTPLVAGRYGRAFTEQFSTQWTGFTVETGAAARQRSEYNENVGDKFFAAAGVDRAVDAGKMSIDADSSLTLQGIIDAQALNGRGAQLDIIADAIEVVEHAGANSNTIQLEAGALNHLGVDSLLLGGRRTRDGADMNIVVGAQNVSVRSGAELSIPDLILAARDNVRLDGGAKITTTGQSTVATERFLLNGDGAFLRASSGAQADVVRSNVAGTTGNLLVAQGSSITGSTSVLLDSTANMSLAGQLALNQGSLNLTANKISIGAVPNNTVGVALDSADLAALNAATLRLSSRNGIDFYGNIDFSNQIVELNTGTLRNMALGNARISAGDTLQLSNTAQTSAVAPGTSGSSLLLAARRIELGSERDHDTRVALQGFNSVQLGSAGLTQEIVGQGQFEFASDGAIAVVADRVTANSGANTAITATGRVDLARANAPALDTTAPLGGSVSISGKRIEQGTAIDLAGGKVELVANGVEASDGVHLLDASSIDVSGRSIASQQGWENSSGSSILLRSASGDVTADAGSSVTLNGGAHGGDAGTLNVQADNGQINWLATTSAHANATGVGGSLNISAANVANFSGWLERIAVGGFDQSVRLHSGAGDLLIDRNVRAKNIDISTDTGALTLAATLDASGEKGGQVALFAGNDVVLAAGSRIDAHATAADARGGKVALGTTQGVLQLQQGSAIDVSGGADGSDADVLAGRGGRVQLRAPRINGNTDIAVTDNGISIVGAEAIVMEAVSAYSSTLLSSVDAAWTQALNSANDFMAQANVDAIKTRLGAWAQTSVFHVRPGIEINSGTDLIVAGDAINFSSLRFGADTEPGVLTLRARGNVILQTSLLDGLVAEADTVDVDGNPIGLNLFTGGVPNMLLMSGASWQYQIAAGANAAAANPNAVIAGSGDIQLVDGADLITGAADITLNAGGDIVANRVDTVIASLGLSSYRNYGVGLYDGLNLGGYLPDSGTIDSGTLAFALGYKRLMFPEQGGDVLLGAGGDIHFAQADVDAGESGHFFSDWMLRIAGDLGRVFGGLTPDFNATTWGVWTSYFNYGDSWNGGAANAQGVAVLGGGDLKLDAGRDIVNLNAALPVTGKQVGTATTGAAGGNLPVEYPLSNVVQILGGGDLVANAGRNIVSPRILVDKGLAQLNAGGSIGAISGSGLDAIFALADTDLQIRARDNVGVASVFNSTVMPQSNLLNPGGSGAALIGENYFFTYSERARVDISSIAGDINLNRDTASVLAVISPRLASRSSTPLADQLALSLYPANLQLTALSGDIGIGHNDTAGAGVVTLFPSTTGQLNLFAAGNISSLGSEATLLNMTDIPRSALADVYNPANEWFVRDLTSNLDIGAAARFFSNTVESFIHTPIHTGDTGSNWITALTGDITALKLSLPKMTQIFAGRDIDDTGIAIQHTNADSISQIMAGRDIIYPLNIQNDGRLLPTSNGISIAGPGRLDVIAGRDINLRLGTGIQSTGNVGNSALPESGADISVMVGINGATAATDAGLYAAFVDRYFSDADNLSGSFIDWFGTGGFGNNTSNLLSVFTGKSYASTAAALQAFSQLPVLTRQAISVQAYQVQKSSLQSTAIDAGTYAAVGGYTTRYSAELVDFVSLDRFSGDLTGVVTAVTGQTYHNNSEAAAAMALLTVAQQHAIAKNALASASTIARREVVLDTLMAEIRKGGVENAKGLFTQDARYAAVDGFDRSRAAIALMFPGNQWRGNLNLAFSSVQATGGGDINLFAPGGNVDVGLAGNLSSTAKNLATGGVVTPLYGAINSVVSGNISVNQSRVFSLDGAPITLWSSRGNIDAGKGAKTAVSVPAPRRVFNPDDGSVTLIFPPAVAGSGIQAASNLAKTPTDRGPLQIDGNGFVVAGDTLADRQRFYRSLAKGDVFLFAPEGVVNAGDAGISVAGNLLIAAQQVLGANNISVGGISIGVPTTTSISAGTLSLGDVASSATESATNSMNDAIKEAAAALAESSAAFVTVDIIGVGN